MMNARVMMKPVAMLAAIVLPLLASAATWTGAADRDWFNTNNWDSSAVPGTGASVTVPIGKTILLTNETADLAAFTMAGGSLTFSNWTTRLRATEIAIDGGTLTLPPAFTETQMSNRVWIVCSNFTLAATAAINVQGRGYTVEQGQGKGNSRGGAGHGGTGGLGSSTAWAVIGKIYGSPSLPRTPGSGGGAAITLGSGGGAVWIDAEGVVTIHGEISVRGNDTTGNGGGGSGGSILIESRTFKGSATGLLNAAGGNGGGTGGGGGGGGRIAILYDGSAQADLAEPNPPVQFLCGPGTGGAVMSATARPGTLYLPDVRFLSANMSARWGNVVLVIPSFTTWSLPSLTIGGKIGFTGLEVIQTTGALELQTGGRLTLHGTPTNTLVPGAGMYLDVGSVLKIANNGELELICNPQNGVAPYVECGSLDLQAGGKIMADWHGFAQATGPGAGSARGGAGYGGQGSPGTGTTPGPTYGSAHAPVQCGSGGGDTNDGGGKGGGLVRVSARDAMRVSGTVSVSGMIRVTTGSCGGGSGGGILLSAKTFSGAASGLLQANGGDTSSSVGGAGGGGRIAVWTPFIGFAEMNKLALSGRNPPGSHTITPSDAPGFTGVASAFWPSFSGTASVKPGTLGGNPALATPGTIMFGRQAGTLILIR